jgi:hypothetical protein
MAIITEDVMKRTNKGKNDLIEGVQFFIQFINNLFMFAKEYKLSNESLYDELKKESFAKRIIESVAKEVGKLKLEFLKVIKSGIEIVTGEFSKNLFTNGQVKYFIWGNFRNCILKYAPNVIPIFSGKITTLQTSKSMENQEILKEIGEHGIFSISEVLAVIKLMTERQPNGEEGDLLTNGRPNIIYVRVDDPTAIVSVHTFWNSAHCEWNLNKLSFYDGSGWNDGGRVLVRC